MTLRPTYRHPRAAAYRAVGGPWDVPTLPNLVGGAPQLAGGLRNLGIRRGDVVAWQAPNVPEVAELYRACWQLGAVAAPIHHQASEAEVSRLLDRLGPALFVARDELRVRVAALADGPPYPTVHARPTDLAAVLWTGGSEGIPKGVLHTHRGLAHKATTMVRAHGLTPADVVLMPAPLAHISGLLNGVLVPGAAGMRTVLMERWDPEHALTIIEREHVSFMIGPPTFFVGLVDVGSFARERVTSLRLVSSGGAGVTSDFVESAREQLGAHVKRSYGSTEAPTITTSTSDDPLDRATHTDGRVVGSTALKIATDGELLVQGPELFAGYLDASQTQAAVTRGWFHTGDLATIDDGWLTIVGRKKDIIIRGGENIAAAEVERIVAAHPAVREVAAVGEPHDRLGERVCVFVVGDATFDLAQCRHWFESRGVAKFKTPERVEHVDTMPTLPAGKIDRATLRARLAP
ncbi:MAG: AMP-binding protein [Acidimicrobiia bacterium]|nr:AMP-binding protein [Acidimicrobiia bacterium]